METLIVDASIAVKWVVDEQGTGAAVGLRGKFLFAAPDLLSAECANILWKKVQRGDLTREEAALAARLLQRAGVELLPMRTLMEPATILAVELGHPAYDCVYIALARQRLWRFVTADGRLLRVIRERAAVDLSDLCVGLDQIAANGG